MIKKNHIILTLVITAFFISAYVIIPSLQEKAYAAASTSSAVLFKFKVKHVFTANSKIKVTVMGHTNKVTVPGKSGTRHVDLNMGQIINAKKGTPYTICLSAPHHSEKCKHNHLTSKSNKHFQITEHKTVDMKVLHH